jgi:tRNA (cmo5U34)-methyltransferase
VEEIRTRFDHDVERFSRLDTGQEAAMDSPLMMTLATRAAAAVTPHARDVLDIGCGAGNYSLKLLEALPGLNVTLLDLSRPMLDRAAERVSAATRGEVATIQADVRDAYLPEGSADVVLAAMVLHHLRADEEWAYVFRRVYRWLRPGGSFWVVDMVEHASSTVDRLMRERWGEHLAQRGGADYRDKVFAYVQREDTPRPLGYQLRLLRRVGFERIDVLHKAACFAAFGGVKPMQVA